MEKNVIRTALVMLLLLQCFCINALADEALINDIFVNPDHYWNKRVTLVGEVQNVNADPVGTSGGTYTLLDDSCANLITISTSNLPLVGQVFSVSGLVMRDPKQLNVPLIKEVERADAGGLPASTRNLLLGLGAFLLILIIIFIIILLNPRRKIAAPSRSEDMARPEFRPEDHKLTAGEDPTIVLPMAAAQDGNTQLLQNPLAELLVEQGSDRGKVFTVSKRINAIGRSGARCNDIVLTDITVSKEQAALHFDPLGGRFSIVNESSKNQTKVNGIIASQRVFLDGGESIEMGRTVLRFKLL